MVRTMIKNLDIKAAKHGRKPDSLSSMRASQVSTLLQLKDIAFPTAADLHRASLKSDNTSVPHSITSSRAVSPFSRKPSPLRSVTPVPTMSGLSFSKSVSDSLKKTNELLTQEVLDLRAQVDTLKQHCERQELEVHKSAKKAQEAMKLAAEESAKSKAAKEVIKSLTAQLKEMAEQLPLGVYDNDGIRSIYMLNGIEPHVFHNSTEDQQLRNERNSSHLLTTVQHTLTNGILRPTQVPKDAQTPQMNDPFQDQRVANSNGQKQLDVVHQKSNGRTVTSSRAADVGNREPVDFQNTNGSKTKNPSSASTCQVEAEWIEQYEPGVYITLVALHDGTRDLKRVRFSRRRFGEHQAEIWWSENREKVYEKYNVRGLDRPSSTLASHSTRRSEEDLLTSPQIK